MARLMKILEENVKMLEKTNTRGTQEATISLKPTWTFRSGELKRNNIWCKIIYFINKFVTFYR